MIKGKIELLGYSKSKIFNKPNGSNYNNINYIFTLLSLPLLFHFPFANQTLPKLMVVQ